MPMRLSLSFEQAIEKKSTHGKPDGYLLFQGDLDAGFQDSDVQISGEVRLKGQSHFYLEPSQCSRCSQR